MGIHNSSNKIVAPCCENLLLLRKGNCSRVPPALSFPLLCSRMQGPSAIAPPAQAAGSGRSCWLRGPVQSRPIPLVSFVAQRCLMDPLQICKGTGFLQPGQRSGPGKKSPPEWATGLIWAVGILGTFPGGCICVCMTVNMIVLGDTLSFPTASSLSRKARVPHLVWDTCRPGPGISLLCPSGCLRVGDGES